MGDWRYTGQYYVEWHQPGCPCGTPDAEKTVDCNPKIKAEPGAELTDPAAWVQALPEWEQIEDGS